jgi:hypothetical protein
MAIFSDLELQRIMNEDNKPLSVDTRETDSKLKKQIQDRTGQMKDLAAKATANAKSNIWINKKKADDSSKGKKKITFKEDANGNIIDCTLEGEEYFEEGKKNQELKANDKGKKVVQDYEYGYNFKIGKYNFEDNYRRKVTKDECVEEGKNASTAKQLEKKADDMRRDLTNSTAIELEKEKQSWREKPAEKALTTAADIATGGGVIRSGAKFLGKSVDKGIKSAQQIIKQQEKNRKAANEAVDWRDIYRSEEYTRAMNEFFDITDRETRKVLLAVNEADQNKVLVSLTSKLYDNVVDRVDDIDFGEIERSRGDIEKLPNFETLHECLNNMARLLIEFKQDTKPVDTIAESVSDIIESKGIWTKAYAVNSELPMITYNTIVLAIIEATSYMVSMCVDFVKSPSQDTMQIMIDKSALTKSKGHLLFKNLESFNEAYRKGQVTKAMEHVLDETVSKKTMDTSKKNFLGFGIYTGGAAVAAVVGVAGLLFCIIPIIRELIFLFFYYRVRISEFFDVQADLLQVSAYNVENNRLDLNKEERKNISKKQMKVAEDFRKIARKIAIDGTTAEKSASKDIKAEDSKKYKASDVMDELPDSASSALF